MSPPRGKLHRWLRGGQRGVPMLGGFFDSLLQSFENCRAGLSDETLRAGEQSARPFFLEIYEKERDHLIETVRLYEAGLPEATQGRIFEKVEELARKVVLPAYARVATRFTERERNDFYLVPEPLHGVERFGWGAAGLGLGFFVLWAPFIPIWEKEWVLPFVVGGLFFPNIRRYLSMRRYQSELNRIVANADDEIRRMEVAELTSPAHGERSPGSPIAHRAESANAAKTDGRLGRKERQGGR